MVNTNKNGLAKLTKEELMLTNGGEAGDLISTGGKLVEVLISVLEQIGKNIAEGNEHTPYYGQGK